MSTITLSNIQEELVQEELVQEELVQEELVQEELENKKRQVRIGPDWLKTNIMNHFKVQLKAPKSSLALRISIYIYKHYNLWRNSGFDGFSMQRIINNLPVSND